MSGQYSDYPSEYGSAAAAPASYAPAADAGAPASYPPPAAAPAADTAIYVGNLPYSASEEELRQMFGTYGEVTRVNIVMDRYLVLCFLFPFPKKVCLTFSFRRKKL